MKPIEFEMFKVTIENVPIHVILTDANGIIKYANPAVEDITGYSPGEVIGKTAAVWGGHMEPGFYEELWDTIKRKKQPFQGQLINKRKDGTYYNAEILINPIIGAFGVVKGFVGIERDITQLKQAWDDLEKRNRLLEEFYKRICGQKVKMNQLNQKVKQLGSQRELFIKSLFGRGQKK